jgi:hypothetical protein
MEIVGINLGYMEKSAALNPRRPTLVVVASVYTITVV